MSEVRRVRVEIVTIFPEYLAPLRVSLVGKAIENGVLDLRVHDLRDWTQDVHRTVDDTPYGGGPGMVMRPEPWGAALDDLVATQSSDGTDSTDNRPPRVIVPTPSGRPFTQRLAAEYAAEPWLLFACGRYEGLDGRVVEDARTRMRVDEVSLGDYVLAGGEVAALVVVEAVARLLPGVLGNAESARDDSFAGGEATGGLAGLLEGPTYTKPSVWRGREVPEVLRSGNHAMIARWRRDEALRRTARVRPDLIAALDPDRLDGQDRAVLSEVVGEAALQRFLSGPDSVAD